MNMRYDFSRSSIYSVLNHLSILNEKNLISFLRHPNTHIACELLRLIASYDLVSSDNPQSTIDFILSHRHLTPYLEACKTLASYKLLNKDYLTIISSSQDAYIMADAILVLQKNRMYSDEYIQKLINHPFINELINLWTLIDMIQQLDHDLFQFTLNHPNPKLLVNILCLFQKRHFLESKLVNRFFFCLQHNPEKPPELIATHMILRAEKHKESSYQPELATIPEEESFRP